MRLTLSEAAFNDEPIAPVNASHQAVRLETLLLMQSAVADEIFHEAHSFALELYFSRIGPFLDLGRPLPVEHRMVCALHVMKVSRLSHLFGPVPTLLQRVDRNRPQALPVGEDI